MLCTNESIIHAKLNFNVEQLGLVCSLCGRQIYSHKTDSAADESQVLQVQEKGSGPDGESQQKSFNWSNWDSLLPVVEHW